MDEKRDEANETERGSGIAAPPPYTASAFPPAQDYPPPQQPLAFQQPVPYQQPQGGVRSPPTRPARVDDTYQLSFWLSILWCFVGAPYLLCCTIPALKISKESRRAKAAGDYVTAKEKANTALILNFVSIAFGFGAFIIFFSIILPAAIVAVVVPLSIVFSRPQS